MLRIGVLRTLDLVLAVGTPADVLWRWLGR
jgi:hypothetical protein